MKKTEIDNKIRTAVNHSVPDVLDSILSRCEEHRERGIVMNTTHVKKPRWTKTLSRIAAVLILVAVGVSGYFVYGEQAVDSVIAFEVNPSLEIKINKNEKVLDVIPLNEEARVVIGNMDFKNTNLEMAVNALIGSMLKNGYIDDMHNSILVSVENKNEAKRTALGQRLRDEIMALLKAGSIDGAVLSQSLSDDDDVKTVATENEITRGKAQLILQLVSKNPKYTVEELAKLSINELNILIGARHIELENTSIEGTASTKVYIGKNVAVKTALDHAGLSDSAIRDLDVDLDYDDGRWIYEVEFKANNFEYDYDIDALTGKILSVDKDDIDDDDGDDNNPALSTYIGKDNAVKAALNHAGLSASAIRDLEVELDEDDGRWIYEVEFKASNFEYDYDIDALTGKVLSVDKDDIDDDDDDDDDYYPTQPTQPTNPPATPTRPANPPATPTQPAATTRMSAATARAKVINKFGGGIIQKIEYAYDESNPKYKGEALKDGYRVVFELNANLKAIKEWDKWDVGNDNTWDDFAHALGQMITMNQAANSVISRSGKSNTFVQKIDFLWDDSEPLYQGEAFSKGVKYSFEINANNGDFEEWDVSTGDDTWEEKYYNVQ
ncbi:MAG: PepSY domain-containing protein [Clostridiaceae bacterium]|nr:PepSY domain-containing protein [Clostridiaceae bacterium]